VNSTKGTAGLIDNTFILRIAFLFSGQFGLYEGFQDWNRGRADLHPEVAILTVLVYAVSILVLAVSLMGSDVILRLRHLPLMPFIIATLTSVYVVAEIAYNGSYRTDVLAYSQYAAILFVKQGANPYLQDMTNALYMFRVQPGDLTPLTSGDYLINGIIPFQYPALHFLVFVPFVLLGLADMRWVLVAFEIGVVLTLYFSCPQNLRPMILLPLFAGSDLMINFTAASVTDMLWVMPLVFAAFTLRKPALSGLFYGISCAFKQIPWLLAPFLLIYMAQTSPDAASRAKLMRALRFAGAAVAVFLAVNLPFMVGSPTTWFGDVLTPLVSDLVILSQGPSIFTQLGIVEVGRAFYTVLAVGVLAVLFANFYVYFNKLQYIFWIFPGIILWFSFRALTNYIIYWLPLLLVSLILWYKDELMKAGRS
jgi:uncharacterized membrane protein